MKRFLSIFATIAIVFSCTNYQEEEVAVGIGTNVNELSYDSYESFRSLRVSSGTKWEVVSMPSWISLQSINSVGGSRYEWSVDFRAKTNDGYNREGTIVIWNESATLGISVVQAGKNGNYVAVESVSVSPKELTLTEGETTTLTASVAPRNASDKSVTWSSNNSTVARVSDAGIVTARSVGSAKITVKTVDGSKTASCSLTVKAKTIPVQGVSIDKASITMAVGDTQTLTATVTPLTATDKSVTWSSGNTSVATVSSTGVVTAKGVGTATITVTTNDGGKKATCSVTVTPVAVTGVTLNKSSLSLYQNDSETLVATVLPSNATNKSVSWSTSNSSVATVTSNGQVTAVAAGTATITVTTADGGMTASCAVSVTADPYGAVDLGLSVKWASFNYGASSVTSTGGYYMWGDPNGTGEPFFFTPPSVNSISGTQYDIVRKNWGGSWRIPTRAEINELYSNCTWTKTTLNGVSVLKVTGRNGASIYLPFTGYGMPDDGPVGTVTVSDGSNAYMMSAESYGDSYGRFVYVFYFTPSGSKNTANYNASFIKFPIRPVR
ncbi:MAG: Ig-like domain-containing protein [Bacteroidales bacterium]|nr:Ig-like domain-containing protein [Bacteroidales bacterium]